MSKLKKLLCPRNLIIFFLIFSFSIIFLGLIITNAWENKTYDRLNRGSELAVNNNYKAVGTLGGISRKIVNNSGADYFVPTNSVDEWNRFLSAAPGLGVTVVSEFCGDGSCGPPLSRTVTL